MIDVSADPALIPPGNSRGLAERTGSHASGGVAKPLEAVENEVEPDLELVRVAVAGRRDVLGDRLGEVGVTRGGELAEDPLRRLRELVGGVERHGQLLER